MWEAYISQAVIDPRAAGAPEPPPPPGRRGACRCGELRDEHVIDGDANADATGGGAPSRGGRGGHQRRRQGGRALHGRGAATSGGSTRRIQALQCRLCLPVHSQPAWRKRKERGA